MTLQHPLVPATGTHENRECETIFSALLDPAIFVGTRKAGTQLWIPAYAGMSGRCEAIHLNKRVNTKHEEEMQ
jgi:hypothetical protein